MALQTPLSDTSLAERVSLENCVINYAIQCVMCCVINYAIHCVLSCVINHYLINFQVFRCKIKPFFNTSLRPQTASDASCFAELL